MIKRTRDLLEQYANGLAFLIVFETLRKALKEVNNDDASTQETN